MYMHNMYLIYYLQIHSFLNCDFHQCESLFLNEFLLGSFIARWNCASATFEICHSFSEQYYLHLQIRWCMVMNLQVEILWEILHMTLPIASRFISVVTPPLNDFGNLILLICCWFCISDTVVNIMLVKFFNPLYDCSNCFNLLINSMSVVRTSFIYNN